MSITLTVFEVKIHRLDIEKKRRTDLKPRRYFVIQPFSTDYEVIFNLVKEYLPSNIDWDKYDVKVFNRKSSINGVFIESDMLETVLGLNQVKTWPEQDRWQTR